MISGCSGLSKLIRTAQDAETITPSDVLITDTREVTSFNAITFSTFGRVNLTQGDSESLTITSSDNLVPLIRTTVGNGVLFITFDQYSAKNLNVNLSGVGNLDIARKVTPA